MLEAARDPQGRPLRRAEAEGRRTPGPRSSAAGSSSAATSAGRLEALGGPPPDLVVAHGGQGAPIAFLREVIDAPIINYCEYYFPDRFADLTYRVDLPPAAEIAPFYPRCINAPTLMALLGSDAGYAPTRFQRDSFPERFRVEDRGPLRRDRHRSVSAPDRRSR